MRGRSRFTFKPPAPYSLDLTAARFVQLPDGVNRFEGGVFRRLLVVDARPLLVRVQQLEAVERPVLGVWLQGDGADSAAAREAALGLLKRCLGVTIDVRPFYEAFEGDPLLGPAIEAFRGLRLAGLPSLWEAIVTAVLAQQVNLRFAYSIRRELVRAFGQPAQFDGETYFAFPAPERMMREGVDRLRGYRLSAAKAGTLQRVAAAFSRGELSEAELAALPDEEVVARLMATKGIGRWTAETALIRGLGRVDAFPGGDLGVVKYVAQGLLGRRERASEREMREFAEGWRPYRALALIYAYAELGRRRDRSSGTRE